MPLLRTSCQAATLESAKEATAGVTRSIPFRPCPPPTHPTTHTHTHTHTHTPARSPTHPPTHPPQDYEDPSGWVHFKAEGDVEFKALVFLPKARPEGDCMHVCVCSLVWCSVGGWGGAASIVRRSSSCQRRALSVCVCVCSHVCVHVVHCGGGGGWALSSSRRSCSCPRRGPTGTLGARRHHTQASPSARAVNPPLPLNASGNRLPAAAHPPPLPLPFSHHSALLPSSVIAPFSLPPAAPPLRLLRQVPREEARLAAALRAARVHQRRRRHPAAQVGVGSAGRS